MSKLHGVTKIELYNPNTKIKNIVKSENTFQGSVIAQYLRSASRNSNVIADDDTWAQNYDPKHAPWQKYVGGLFLFRDTINVGDHFMSKGNQMVGNGSWNVVNAESPNSLGSFNVNESTNEIENVSAITQVYDFGTSQANGEIGCVCLTSQAGGLIGYGNKDGDILQASRRYMFSRNQYLKSVNPIDTPDWTYGCTIGNMQWRFVRYDSDNKKIIFNKSRVPLSQGSVFDGLIKTVEFDVSSLSYDVFAEGSTISIASVSDKKIYLTNNYWNTETIQPSGTWKYWVINTENETITEKTFTNVSTHTVSSHSYSVAHGILAFKNNAGYTLTLFDETTGVLLDEIDITDESYPSFAPKIAEYPNGLIGFNTHTGNKGEFISFYDPDNGTVYPTNGQIYTDYLSIPPTYNIYSNVMSYNTRYGVFVFTNPLYLATINNLSSPVTKTAAQTMKVTYTLTEA